MAQSPAKRHKKGVDDSSDEADVVSTVAPSDADAMSAIASSDGADAVSVTAMDPTLLWETAAGNRDSLSAGVELTEQNLGEFEHGLGEMSDRLQQQEKEEMEKAPVLNKNEARKFAALQQAMDEGKMDASSYLAKTFRAALDDEKMKSFAKLGRAEQAAFRLEWAKAQYGSFREIKSKTKSWRRIDVKKGTYMNLSNVIISEGGFQDKEAVKGAQRLVAMCLAMGPPWHMKHPQTKRVLYLRLDYSYVEEFEEMFQQCKQEYDNGVLTSKTAGDGQSDKVPEITVDNGDGELPQLPQTSSEVKPKGKAKAQVKGKVAAPSDASVAFAKLWTDATKLRIVLISVLGSAQQMLDIMASSVEWEWDHHPIQQAFVWGWTPSTQQQTKTNRTNEHRNIKGAWAPTDPTFPGIQNGPWVQSDPNQPRRPKGHNWAHGSKCPMDTEEPKGAQKGAYGPMSNHGSVWGLPAHFGAGKPHGFIQRSRVNARGPPPP
jgi:hypothetical protein